MRTLDRYVVREILAATLIAVVVLSVVLVLGNISRRLMELLVNHQVPAELILSFIAYVLPFSLTYTIPWGFLTAVLIVFSRMSADHEITAMRTSGISLGRIALPVMGTAVVLCGICLWINLSVAPAAQQTMRNVLFDIAVKNPLALFASDQTIEEFPGRRIYIGQREGGTLSNIQVFELDEENRPIRVMHAQRGRIEADLEEERILLHLEEALYEERDRQHPDDLRKIRHGITGSGTFPVSLQELQEQAKSTAALSDMTLDELQNKMVGESSPEASSAVRTEISKRFSSAFASLAFAMVGVPLAVSVGRRETSVSFGIGLGVAFAYFGFLIFAESQGANPALRPEWIAWVPNLVFLILGLCLFAWRRRA